MKRIVRDHLRKRVIITLKTGEGFGGVLVSADSEAVAVYEATLLDAAGSDRVPTPVDGHMVFLRDNIAYLQFP